MGKQRDARRMKKAATKMREKARPAGYDDYEFEVVLFPERLRRDRRVSIRYARSVKVTHRMPGTGRRRTRKIVPNAVERCVHDEIMEALKPIMQCRFQVRRNGWLQRTSVFLQTETSIFLLKTLFNDSVWKVYRLVDKEQTK